MSGAQGTPKDEEGREIVRQFSVLAGIVANRSTTCRAITTAAVLTSRRRGGGESGSIPRASTRSSPEWTRAKRPYPIEGTWERYSFRVGNLLFLMMSDINEPSQKSWSGNAWRQPGRCRKRRDVSLVEAKRRDEPLVDHRQRPSLRPQGYDRRIGRVGGNAARREWRMEVLVSRLLSQGTPQGASFLYWVDSKPDSGAFENILAATPARSTCGSARTLTRAPTIPTAGNRTSNGAGARPSST